VRILGIGKFYPPEYHGGIETAITSLNDRLVRQGTAVTYVVSAVRGRGGDGDVGGVRVVRAASLGTVLSQPLSPGLIAAVRREAGDVLHLHHPNPLGDIAALADRGRPLVVTQHSDIVRQRLLRPLYGFLVRSVFARARAIAVASEQFLRVSRELRGFERKVRVIPYGIDPGRFDATAAVLEDAARLRAMWGGGPVVLAVGRLVGYKGFDVLIRAMEGLDARLVIVGEGPESGRLRAIAGRRVTLAGPVSEADLPAYYHAAEVFCLPSLTIAEAFGIVLLEAMACRKPLVTTSIPTGVSAVNRDEETGLVVPPGEVGPLREALRALLGDVARRREMGGAARRVLEREYTSALMAEHYLTLYREALA
jgi:glycosyltransferase involved in cell wall biosynthesis